MTAPTDVSLKSLLLLRDLIEQRIGIYYSEQQLLILADKIRPRLAELGLSLYLDYYYYLKYDGEAMSEWKLLECAITVNETYFWRESEALKLVADHLLQEIDPLGNRIVRIWHAGCSTGEEPYSLAIALSEAGCFEKFRVRIVATDIDSEVLAHAEQGIYRERSLRFLAPEIVERYFDAHPAGRFALTSDIKSRVQFLPLNLVDKTALTAFRGFDIIFCRNVMIYFRDPLIKALAAHFFEALQQPGYLFVSATESLLRFCTAFEFAEKHGSLVYFKPKSGCADGR